MEDTAHATVMGQHRAWGVGETVRRVVWLEQREREGGRERGGRAGPCELWENLGFHPKGGGSPGGLQAEVWDLTQELKALSGGCGGKTDLCRARLRAG